MNTYMSTSICTHKEIYFQRWDQAEPLHSCRERVLSTYTCTYLSMSKRLHHNRELRAPCSHFAQGIARTMGEEKWIQTLHSSLERGFFEGRKTTERITESQPTAPSQRAKKKQPELRAACWSFPDGIWFFQWFRVHHSVVFVLRVI